MNKVYCEMNGAFIVDTKGNSLEDANTDLHILSGATTAKLVLCDAEGKEVTIELDMFDVEIKGLMDKYGVDIE